MGVYLSAPKVEKESVDEECSGFAYGASSMQGWRVSQEDAHNCIPEFIKDSDTSFFAVYDGHGGAEVAKYCELNFPQYVKSVLEKGTGSNLTDLLQSAFLQFDATLAEDDVVKKLKELAGKDDDNDDDDDPDVPVGKTETDLLKAEADMPLEELLTRYKSDPNAQSAESVADGESSGCSSSGMAASSSSLSNLSSSHSTNGPVKEVSNNNNKECDIDTKKNHSNSVGKSKEPSGSSSSAGGSSSSGDDSGVGERASKTKALSDIAAAECLDDSSDDDDDEDEDETEDEELWEDCDDDDDDDDEEDEDVDSDVPMMDMTNEEPGSDSGCTACVVLKQKDKLIVANAGDSRCVLSRGGVAVELSFDHKPEDDPERERIEKAGGKVTSDGRVNGGLNLSRALGDHVYKRNKDFSLKEQMISALPDIKSIDLESNDEFFVIACDGIWNFMSSQEVVDYVRERLSDPENRKKPSLINEELFDHCLAPNILGDGTGCDNMTCIIVVLDSAQKLDSQEKHTGECIDPIDKSSVEHEEEHEDCLKRKCDLDNGETDEAKRVKVDKDEA